MKSKQIRMITHGAILAALYVALTYLQNWLLPGTTSAAIQFRASEALCIFALFTPAAIPGLTVGCLLFNISNAGAGHNVHVSAAPRHALEAPAARAAHARGLERRARRLGADVLHRRDPVLAQRGLRCGR